MSLNKYPEHLNPFAEEPKRKSTLKLSNSFREFTKTLRKSFRIKKKTDHHDNNSDVEIRQKSETFQRLPISYPNGTETLTPALPRSRFQERLTKSRTFSPTITSTPTMHKYNPFEEEDNGGTKIEPPNRRRGKRRAPPPPKSISSQNVNSLDPQHSSHWSLTSADTDITYSTDNISEAGYNTDGDRLSITENFVDFNKEMEKLNEQTSNNNNSNSNNKNNDNDNDPLTKDKDNIPDLVVTCANNVESDLDNDIHQNSEIKNESDSKEIIEDSTQNLQNPEINEQLEEAAHGNVSVIENVSITENQHETKDDSENVENDVSVTENISVTEKQNQITDEPEDVENGNVPVTENVSVTENVDDTKEIAINKDNSSRNGDIDENPTNTKEILDNNNSIDSKDIEKLSLKDEDQPFLYHENKSLYIAGSRDDLVSDNTYTGRYSLYIEGSKENLDQCNNEIIENNNEPVPKQRKNKLSKNLLLGTAQ